MEKGALTLSVAIPMSHHGMTAGVGHRFPSKVGGRSIKHPSKSWKLINLGRLDFLKVIFHESNFSEHFP